jgi:hypothetical protein
MDLEHHVDLTLRNDLEVLGLVGPSNFVEDVGFLHCQTVPLLEILLWVLVPQLHHECHDGLGLLGLVALRGGFLNQSLGNPGNVVLEFALSDVMRELRVGEGPYHVFPDIGAESAV